MQVSKKQKQWHVVSILAAIMLTVCFAVLGGGATKAYAETESKEAPVTSGLNLSIPEAEETELSNNRLEALKKQSMQEERDKRQAHLQASSFDWLEASGQETKAETVGRQKAVSETMSNVVVEEVESELKPKAKSAKSSKSSKSAQSSKTRKSKKKKTKTASEQEADPSSTEARMRAKRKRLEKEFGINLSDYGYTKYADPIEETDNKEELDQALEETSKKLAKKATKKGFYGIGGNPVRNQSEVRAVVHGEHKNVAKGNMIKLRLLDAVSIDGVEVPKNTFVFGRLSFAEGRAMIRLGHINYHDQILPFAASVYDRDGFEGLCVPDNVVDDTQKKAIGNTVSGLNLNLRTPMGVVNSATNALTSAVKTAVQSSVREYKITISANYVVTLKTNDKK